MAYYQPNNLYQNYGYNYPYQIPQQPASPQSIIQGKIVESADAVKVADVPFGSYGVFPKGDMSEVYIKTWNNNGTTSILTYQPVATKEEESIDTNKLLMERMKAIEEKLDNLIAPSQLRKELTASDY